MVFDDLHSYIDAAVEVDEWQIIEDADWNQEIDASLGAVVELIRQSPVEKYRPVLPFPAL